jgi:hypothetical protein
LGVVFANSGAAAATGVTGVLRVPSPWAAVLDSVYALGTLGAGGSIATAGQVRCFVSAGTPDGSVLPFEFRSTDGADVWTDVVNRVVHAPQVELVLVDVDDSGPGGNGDGAIQAGESFDLDVRFKNYGTGAVHGLVSFLASSDPDVIITTGTAPVGSAAPMQEVTSPTSFRLQELSLDENPLTLVLADAYLRYSAWPMTLRGPTAPPTPVLDATQGTNVVVCSWTPSSVPDLAGYHVYRSLSGAGPWARITADRTAGVAYYRDTGLQPSTQYYYYVTAVDSSGNESPPSGVAQINTNPAQLAGWPIAMISVTTCPPAVGDITGDGGKEIVAGNSTLYAWDWRGTELRDDDLDPQTWGVFASEMSTLTAAVVLAELDAAPGLEVFVASWNDGNRSSVVRGDGSFPSNWPQNPDSLTAPSGFWAAPAAGDVDGDGRAEIFAAAKNGNLYAWHPDGTPLGAMAAWKSGLGTWSRCSPSLANLDGDPQPEIVYGAPTGTLHVWNADGSDVPGFPRPLGTLVLSSTAIGDVNRDGRQDIVLVTENDSLYVIDSWTARALPGWPVYLPVQSDPISPSPALADFDFDGFLEIVVAQNSDVLSQCSVRVYDHQGGLLPGWPQPVGSHTSESSPIVADFSGDAIPDVVFGNQGGLIYGWDRNGNPLSGFPLTIGDYVRSVPYADDVDGDGDIDLVFAGYDKNLWIWDFTAPWSPAAAQWPTFKHDPQRSGFFGHRATTPTDAGGGTPAASVPPRAFLAQNVPNPFNPLTTIEYGVPALGATSPVQVQLDIHDAKGRRVRRLLGGPQMPGTYQALWDGRDDRGQPLGSGVYIYRLRIAGETLSRKLLLLR